MSAETVINKIREKSGAECSALIDAAKSKAAEIKKASDIEKDARVNEIIKNAERTAEFGKKRAEQQARLEKRICILDAEHELLDTIKSETKAVLASLKDEEWAKTFGKLVTSNPITGNVAVIPAKGDRARYKDGKLLAEWSKAVTEKAGVKTTFTLSENDADIDGGVVLSGETFDIDLSFDSVLDEVFSANEKAIADKLFA